MSQLAADKAALCQSITRNRDWCAAAVVRVAEPLRRLDRLLVIWRQFSTPILLAVVPLGFMLKRAARTRLRFVGVALRWSPVLLGVLRGLTAAPARAPRRRARRHFRRGG